MTTNHHLRFFQFRANNDCPSNCEESPIALAYRGRANEKEIEEPSDAGHFAIRLKLYWKPEVNLHRLDLKNAVAELRFLAHTLRSASEHHGVYVPIVFSIQPRSPEKEQSGPSTEELVNQLVMHETMVRDEFLIVSGKPIPMPTLESEEQPSEDFTLDPDWVLCGIDWLMERGPGKRRTVDENFVSEKYFAMLAQKNKDPRQDVLRHWLADRLSKVLMRHRSQQSKQTDQTDQATQEESQKDFYTGTNRKKFGEHLQQGIRDDSVSEETFEDYRNEVGYLSQSDDETTSRSESDKRASSQPQYKRLSKLKLHAFRGWNAYLQKEPSSADEIDLDADIVMLVGANGVGKSSLTEGAAYMLTHAFREEVALSNDDSRRRVNELLPSDPEVFWNKSKPKYLSWLHNLSKDHVFLNGKPGEGELVMIDLSLNKDGASHQLVAVDSKSLPEDTSPSLWKSRSLICDFEGHLSSKTSSENTSRGNKNKHQKLFNILQGATILQAEKISAYIQNLKKHGAAHMIVDLSWENLDTLSEEFDPRIKEWEGKIRDLKTAIDIAQAPQSASQALNIEALFEVLEQSTGSTIIKAMELHRPDQVEEMKALGKDIQQEREKFSKKFKTQENVTVPNEDYLPILKRLLELFSRQAEIFGWNLNVRLGEVKQPAKWEDLEKWEGLAGWFSEHKKWLDKIIQDEEQRLEGLSRTSNAVQAPKKELEELEDRYPWVADEDKRVILVQRLEACEQHFSKLAEHRDEWLNAWKTIEFGENSTTSDWNSGSAPHELSLVVLDRARTCAKESQMRIKDVKDLIHEYNSKKTELEQMSWSSNDQSWLDQLGRVNRKIINISEKVNNEYDEIKKVAVTIARYESNQEELEESEKVLEQLKDAAERFNEAKEIPEIVRAFRRDVNFIGASLAAVDNVFPVDIRGPKNDSTGAVEESSTEIKGHERKQESTDFSSGQKTQLAMAVMVAQASWLRREYERRHRPSSKESDKVATLLVDDLESLHDRRNMLRDAILWRRVAYAHRGWQVILCVHDDEVASRLCEWLRPPKDRKLKLVRLIHDQRGRPRVECIDYKGFHTHSFAKPGSSEPSRKAISDSVQETERSIYKTLKCRLSHPFSSTGT